MEIYRVHLGRKSGGRDAGFLGGWLRSACGVAGSLPELDDVGMFARFIVRVALGMLPEDGAWMFC